jgi:NAD(P)-dependent dehydrogenase (short-subunit alcohol dehydrogenase family)
MVPSSAVSIAMAPVRGSSPPGSRDSVDERSAWRPTSRIQSRSPPPSISSRLRSAMRRSSSTTPEVPGGGRFTDVTFEAWRRVLDVHVDGTFHVTQAVLPGMTEAGWGRIVNICSEAVWLGNQSVQYVTAKAALVGFTRALGYQLASSGILVNGVAPGPVDTPMLRDNDPEAIEAELASVRIGRFLEPEEIALTVAFLVGPGGDGYVGQVLSPNGGTVFIG